MGKGGEYDDGSINPRHTQNLLQRIRIPGVIPRLAQDNISCIIRTGWFERRIDLRFRTRGHDVTQ